MACASASFQTRSARSSASSGFFFQAVSNHLPSYSPALAAKVALISQYGRDTCLRIFSSRSTTTLSVGVCTRPTVVRKKPPSRELNAVMARVPLMPTSQSASLRLRAASDKPCISGSPRSLSKPSRIACGVMLCSHSRWIGLGATVFFSLTPAYCTIRRKISSPSRPASHALMSALTSLRLTSLTTALNRALALSMGARSKCGGITGRCAKLHLPRLTSNSSGALISTRWPTAEVTT